MSAREPLPLSLLHDLALLYLGLAHGTDDELTPDETRAISVKLMQWQPDRDPALIDHVIREATLSYLNNADRESLDRVIDSVGKILPPDLCQTVLHDLADIARADGTVIANEADLIQQIARRWNVSDEHTEL